jgi:Zn-finger nucleic acid-binding protein
MLACPRCAAPVPESSPTCRYCSAPLLLKACPSCLARVFDGHKFCPGCGAGLERAAGTARERACPRCDVALHARAVGELSLDDCAKCGGTFVDRAALEMLLGEKRAARAESVLGAYDAGGDDPLPQPPGKFYVKCPDCAVVMNRKMFAHGAKVIVDVCRVHGTWFDHHELPRIIRFVMRGGLEAAEKHAIAQDRERLKREAAALRDQQSTVGAYSIGSAESGGFLAAFVKELLR